MKSYRKELWFEVPSRRAFINITPDVMVGAGGSGMTDALMGTILRGKMGSSEKTTRKRR